MHVTFRRLAPEADIPIGSYVRFEVDGVGILATRLAGRVHVVRDLCSHRQQPLCGGRLTGHVLACPAHGGEFDIRSGEPLAFPALRPIQSYESRVRDGFVEIRWPADD